MEKRLTWLAKASLISKMSTSCTDSPAGKGERPKLSQRPLTLTGRSVSRGPTPSLALGCLVCLSLFQMKEWVPAVWSGRALPGVLVCPTFTLQHPQDHALRQQHERQKWDPDLGHGGAAYLLFSKLQGWHRQVQCP